MNLEQNCLDAGLWLASCVSLTKRADVPREAVCHNPPTPYRQRQPNGPACLVWSSSIPGVALRRARQKTVNRTVNSVHAPHSGVSEEVLRAENGWRMGELVPASHFHRVVVPLGLSLPS